MPCCPTCHSSHVIKNGSIHNGKKKYACHTCGRQFVEDPQFRVLSDATNAMIDRLLVEKISLAGIARALGVSETWLHAYVKEKYRTVPREVHIRPKKRAFDH